MAEWKTPGVYVSEINPFPTSIAGVATNVPIFIGYTEKAVDPASKMQAYLQAVSLSSMADYSAWFGGRYAPKYAVQAGTATDFDFEAMKADNSVGYFKLMPAQTVRFNLFAALALFYANGGGDCFVVSASNYQGQRTDLPGHPASAVEKFRLLDGLAVAQDCVGPTMLVVPDACLLPGRDYGDIALAQVKQAGVLQDRVAILDLPDAMDEATWNKAGLAAHRNDFYNRIAPAAPWFSYGTAYAPALQTSVLSIGDVDFTELQADAASSALLKDLLLAQSAAMYSGVRKARIDAKIAEAFAATPAPQVQALNQELIKALPLLAQIETILLGKLNFAPPSGVMAGVWAQNDTNRGVWNAPANIACASVTAPVVLLSEDDQAAYNVPLNGEAINILRSFVDRGTVVWGARTLDGNSNDYRYIQVRRTIVYIEQSIKTALQPFVFAANEGQTWVAVTAMVSGFLQNLWAQGGLMGDKASDAYTVQCGLGSTMTAQDILNGYMIVQVTLQMVHPAEFIELTFKQQMQGAT